MSSAAPSVLELDVEQALSRYLRGRLDVGDRVFTAFPRDAGGDPLVVVQRIGGPPVFTRPLVLERAEVQVSAYGGGKRAAHSLAREAQAALAVLEGVIDDGQAAGAVTVELGAFRDLPDPSFTPPRPRYVFDATVNVRAAALPAGGAS